MKLQLTNLALDNLRNCLSAVGWCKSDNVELSVRNTYLAGKLLAEVLPETVVPEPPSELATPSQQLQFGKMIKTWQKVPSPEFELTDKMLDVCQRAVKYKIVMGEAPSSPHMSELILALKLYSE
jgi:hypothetical protein